ncbi:MAG: glycosyltransferase family 4 protein, partial [Thermoplasmata archaeon]|nr:glycosyltransferase family 4 protein [Thermoplasmata archaeon]
MKIGIATAEYPVDAVGGGVYSTIVAQKLAQMGEEVHVFASITPEIKNEPLREGLFVHEIPLLPKPLSLLSYYPFLLHTIRKVVNQVGPLDVLHSMGTCCFGLPKRSRLWKLNVCTLHHLSKSTIEELRPSIFKRLTGIGGEIGVLQAFEKRIIDWSDVVITVSDYTRDSIARLYDKPLDSIKAIPNAVPPRMLELSETPLKDCSRRLTPEDCRNILHVGRLYYRKRVDFLLKAFARVRQQENARLWLVGPGNVEKYRRLAEDLGIGESVTFTGVVDRITLAKFYRECDVFALTSACEGFGIVLIEAMINGLPVVASINTMPKP